MNTKQTRTIRALGMTVVLIALVLTACSPTPTQAPTQEQLPPVVPTDTAVPPTPEPTATRALSGKQMDAIAKDVLLDPAADIDADSQLINSYIYETLFKMGSDGKPEGVLVTTYTVSEDELDYIFTLRPNVTFQDGTPFNADIVLDNFNRWFDPKSPLRGSLPYSIWKGMFLGFRGEVDENKLPVSFFDGIEKVNDLTVLLHLNRQEPKLLELLSNSAFAMVNTQVLAEESDKYGTAAGSAVGTGAYLLSNRSDFSLVLQPYSGYWGTAGAEPLEFPYK
jgi:peptide/nickel transport system substrate-binding protein